MSALTGIAWEIDDLVDRKAKIEATINRVLSDPKSATRFRLHLLHAEGIEGGPEVSVSPVVGLAAYQEEVRDLDRRIAESRKKLAEFLESGA